MTLLTRNSPPKLERLDGVMDLVQALGGNLCILDTETTGFSRSSGIVEVAYLWYGIDGNHETFSCLINPEMAIPVQASTVHGITNDMVVDAPTYEAVAEGINFILDNAVLSGFNVRGYDVDVLINSNKKVGITSGTPDTLDVRDVWRGVQKTAKGNLGQVAQHYGVEAGPAHEGMGDVITSARVLDAMVRAHGMDTMLQHLHTQDVSRPVNRPLSLA